jgi:putative ABC transport system permease protein
MALVGIKTAITAMQQKFTESFSSMGANGFTIRFKEPRFNFGGNDGLKKEKKGQKKEKKSNVGKPITEFQAETFKSNYQFPAKVSLNLFGARDAVVSRENKKSNPTVRVYGGDENFLDQNGYSLAYGRNINSIDIESGRNICLIGTDIVQKFFGGNSERAVDEIVKVNNVPYRVVGTMEEKGRSMGMSWDNVIITSYKNVRRFINSNPNASFSIQIKVSDIKQLDGAIGEATGTFRPIRKLSTTEEENFAIDKSDTFVEMLLNQLSWLTGAALVIGMITLVGAAIGLMNIMLVAVTERTKEIGLAKAIGGKQGNIRKQFLFEAMIISLMGAFFGVILGVLIGNVASLLMGTSFVVPWNWMFIGILICSIVGLLAGLYPALKASRLNPIEALRYE